VQLQQVMPATPPGAGDRSRLAKKYIVLPCCCILLLYKAGELPGSGFRIYLSDLGGATGIRTPDLLHAIPGGIV
jgi:hypothetical protein